jgi:hypothetical protein
MYNAGKKLRNKENENINECAGQKGYHETQEG